MTVHIEKGTTFLGIPMIQARNVLMAWRYGSHDDAGKIGELKSVDLPPETVMTLLAEFRQRGLIGPESNGHRTFDGLTDKGMALAHASARKRMPRLLAEDRLHKFIQQVSRAAADPDYPYEIDKVWLYGSLIKPEKDTIGDIDIAIEQERRSRFKDLEKIRKIALDRGYKPMSGGNFLQKLRGPQHFLERQILHNGRIPAYLSIGDSDDLISLAEPCQLIYDRKRGGPVSDPVLKKHPKAKTRAANLTLPLQMPSLAPKGEITLLNCSNATPVFWTHDTCEHATARGNPAFARILRDTPVYPYGSKRFDDILSHHPNVQALTKHLDGIEKSALIISRQTIDWNAKQYVYHEPILLLYDRTFVQNGNESIYTLHLKQIAGTSSQEQSQAATALGAVLEFYIFADMAHIKARQAEIGQPAPIRIALDSSLPKQVGADILSTIKYLRDCRETDPKAVNQ